MNCQIPVYFFNPINLFSSKTCPFSLLKDYLKKSAYHVIILDCVQIESKTEFFSEIFQGIIHDLKIETSTQSIISYDFKSFLDTFNTIKPTKDIVLLFKNSSQVNLSHLNDFVRLWERRLKDFAAISQLKFVFDDSVSFMGMESRLRDRFQVQEGRWEGGSIPSIQQVFDELIIESVRNDVPFLLHPILMKRFIQSTVTSTISLNSLISQIKFLIISHHEYHNYKNSDSFCQNFKQVLLFISELSINLKSLRPSGHLFSASKDFYSIIFNGVLTESQTFIEICNELKSLKTNEFALIFKKTISADNINEDEDTKSDKNKDVLLVDNFADSADAEKEFDDNYKSSHSYSHSSCSLEEFVRIEIISKFIEKASNSNKGQENLLKDTQLHLINLLSEHLKTLPITIPKCSIINDPIGNVRRAFEADPQVALQTALKFPLIYLNCGHSKTCCTSELFNFTSISSSELISQTKIINNNRSGMLDTCLLYRISLEFNFKSINLYSWYKSFISIVGESSKRKKNKREIGRENEEMGTNPLLM